MLELLRDPKSRSRGFGIDFFLFWARSKNPEILRIEIGVRKSRVKNSEIPKTGDRDLFFRDVPGISRSDGAEELIDLTTSKEALTPRNLCKIPGNGIFTFGVSREIFIPGIGIFCGMGYPEKKPTLLSEAP